MSKGVVIVPEDLIGVDWVELARRSGLQTLGIHSGGGAAHPVLERLGTTLQPDFRDRVRRAGLELEYELHASHDLMDRDCLATRPELFIADRLFGRRSASGNWCANHPDALAMLGERARALAERLRPTTHRYFLWGEDSNDGWCHCERCADWSPSDQNLLSVNRMARTIREFDSEARVAYLAYLSTLPPPERVKPEPNVFLEFAPIQRCYRHAIDDPRCRVNREHWAQLLALLAIFPPEEAHVLEYWLDISLFSGWKLPLVDTPVSTAIMRRDLAAYRQLGIRSFTTFAVFMNGEYFKKFGDRALVEYAQI